MGLSSALATAMSGLRSTQASLSIVSSNIANTQTPGYVNQTPTQIAVTNGDFGSTVITTGVNRQLDLFIQSQLRTETSGGAYADQIANILGQLQSVYGTPGGNGTLETALNNFTTALQSLSNNAGSSSAQSIALSAAQALAQQLNATTKGVQYLRSNVEQDIGNSTTQANSAMATIAQINTQLQGLTPSDPQAANLMDQRDTALNTLAKLVDIRVVTDSSNQVSVFTTSGMQLVGNGLASQFIFNTAGSLNATSLYNVNTALSGVGSLSLQLPNGSKIDVVANNAISSGQIAADLKLRDETLVQAQTQLDQLAASLSSSLSDRTTSGTTWAGPPAGFNVDTTGLLAGNSITLTLTDTATNAQRQIKIVNVTDPLALPLQNPANANPLYVGANFSAGLPSVVSQLNSALGTSHLVFSNPGGTTLRVTDDATNAVSVTTASATTTVSSIAGGVPQVPLFTDGGQLYTGQITRTGSQMTGLAARISVNPAIATDPTKFSIYNTSPVTPAGDTTRSDFMFSQLTSAVQTFSPATGLGSTSQPFKGTVTSYLQHFVSQQSNAATMAKQLQQGQSVVVSTLQQKFDSTSAVNIDTEMSNLIAVQNTYAANAHVMSVVQSMMQTLLQAQL